MKRWRVPAAGALVGVLLVAAYFLGFHQPRSSRVAALAAETSQLRAEQVPLLRSIGALEKVASSEPAFNAALGLLEKLIPRGLAQPSLVSELQAAAQGAGVELVSLTLSDPQVPEGGPQSQVTGTVLVSMPMTVVVKGPFGAITAMLRQMEVGKDRAVLVGTVALTEADAGYPQLTGTWSGQAFALLSPDDPLLVDPSAPPAAPTATTTPLRETP